MVVIAVARSTLAPLVAIFAMLMVCAPGVRLGRLLLAGDALRVRVVPAAPPQSMEEHDYIGQAVNEAVHRILVPRFYVRFYHTPALLGSPTDL
jgi:hypothetical protein